MTNKIATENDWEKLHTFFSRVYRPHHPLQNRDFWKWQYGNQNFGRSFVCLNEDGEIVGHVGASFGGGYAWIINVYLDAEFRGQGILGHLYQMAREYYPLAATSANKAGLGLYRNMGWYRYCNLQRYVLINPRWQSLPVDELIQPIAPEIHFKKPDGHYWDQPCLASHQFADGSNAIVQVKQGGIRAVDIHSLNHFTEQVWTHGFKWIDYVSSWNDKTNKTLENSGWALDYESKIPWKLDPLVENEMAEISYLSEEPLPKSFVVHRSYSDHGRIGSI